LDAKLIFLRNKQGSIYSKNEITKNPFLTPVYELNLHDTLLLYIENNLNEDLNFFLSSTLKNYSVKKKQHESILFIGEKIYDLNELKCMNGQFISALIVTWPKNLNKSKRFYWLLDSKINISSNKQHFTVNGNTYPSTIYDTNARISASLKDTVYVMLYKSDQGLNSIHFENGTLRVMNCRSKRLVPNIKKDSFPIDYRDWMILELIPSYIGKYAVRQSIYFHSENENDAQASGLFMIMNFYE
jgi:hypothetical protein